MAVDLPDFPAQLVVEFRQATDRWSHQISFRNRKQRNDNLLRSVEGNAENDWPPSAPLQELSEHELPDGAALLGVGMAGTSHWSVSCSTVSAADRKLLKLEFACLAKKTPPDLWLGNSYELDASTIEELSETELTVSQGDLLLTMTAVSEADWGTEIECKDSQIRFRPRQVSNSPVVPSRWAYLLKPRLKDG